MDQLKIEEIFNIEQLQEMQNLFSDATGVASIITTPDGTPLTVPSNFCTLCSKVIRGTKKGLEDCIQADSVLGQLNINGPIVQPCPNTDLWHAGVCISVDGIHLANWLIGQVRKSSAGVGKMISYANKIGANQDQFIKAMEEVPVMSAEQFEKVARMLFVFVNQITEKAHTNLKLKRSLDEFNEKELELNTERVLMNALMDNIPDQIYFKDRESRFIRASQSQIKRFKMNNIQEIIGKTDFDIFTNEHAQQAYSDEQYIVKTGLSVSKEEKETWPDKPDTWVSTIKTALRNQQGDVIGTMGISRDITMKRKMEEQLIKSEERLRTIIENMGDGLCILNSKLDFIFSNPMADEIFGVGKAGLSGKNLFDFIEEDGISTISEKLKHRSMLGRTSYEIDIRRPSGERRTVLISSVPRKDIKGDSAGFYEVFTDITDRKKDEQIIREQNIELQKVNAQKDKFFSIIAHDLRSPFNSFLGLTELLEKELFNMSLTQVQEMAANLRSSATKIFNLLTNLLEWSRLQRGLVTPDLKQLFLKELVCQCSDVLIEMAQQKNISVEINVPDRMVVYADLNMLQIVLHNLLSNAIKFTREQGKIRIGAKYRDALWLEITVEDTGIGIDPQRMGNLFSIDKSTSRLGTNGEPSTGLGLILCKEFIEKQGGTIKVDSQPDLGSTFTLTLPVSAP